MGCTGRRSSCCGPDHSSQRAPKEHRDKCESGCCPAEIGLKIFVAFFFFAAATPALVLESASAWEEVGWSTDERFRTTFLIRFVYIINEFCTNWQHFLWFSNPIRNACVAQSQSSSRCRQLFDSGLDQGSAWRLVRKRCVHQRIKISKVMLLKLFSTAIPW